MLPLAVATDPSWLQRVLPHLDDVLLEQAHLERKAASAALTFLFRYPDQPALQEPLARLAREELEHFELVLRALRRRGREFGRQRPSPYAERLQTIVRGAEPERLLDSLLCSALIEARSCERMRILEEGLREREPELAALYHELVASEARHHGLYVQLARELFATREVAERLTTMARHEATVLLEAAGPPRLHA